MRKALLALLLIAATSLAAEPPKQGFGDLFKAANEAHEAKDYARMEKLLREALERRPFHPRAMYNLAAAFALEGKRDNAVDTLRTLGRMGLVIEPDKDPDFASLKDDFGFGLLMSGIKGNTRPVGHPTRAFRLKDPTFIPEGIAYDEDRNNFFMSSVRQRRIQRIHGDEEHDFVAPGAGGLWSALGMFADAKRRLLWVATAALPEGKDVPATDLGRSGLLAFDLDSGAPKKSVLLPQDAEQHQLGDVIVTPDGKIFTTDSRAGVLYAVDAEHGSFEALTKPGELASPQGLVLSRDKRALYVADYTQGLFRYEFKDKKLTRLSVDREICVYGIDGLYRYDDDLIAIQNGIRPHRVVRFRIERGGKRVAHAQVLAANLPEFDEPTLGVVVGRRLSFVANSQWDKFDKDHQLPPADKLQAPMVMRLTLDQFGDRNGDSRRAPQQSGQPGGAPLELPPVNLPPIRP
jgi:sugar lactone lactonase YvrE